MNSFVKSLGLLAFIVLFFPIYKVIWDPIAEEILASMVKEPTAFEAAFWVYFPYIFLVFLLTAVIMVYRRKKEEK